MLPLSPQELFAQAQQLIAQLQQVAGVPAEGEPVPVDTRLSTVAGQALPTVPGGQRWPMSNRALYEAVAGLSAQLQVLTDLLAATRADVLPRLLLAQAAADKSLANDAANSARLDALALQEQADALADAALQAYQARAESAQAATQAQVSQAIAAAATAQSKAEAAQATATQAQALAQAAQASQALLAARFRVARLASPAIAVGGTGTLQVTWSPAFADDKYSVVAECEGAALLGLEATVTARTATGCTVQLKNSLGLNLALGAGTISLLATHD